MSDAPTGGDAAGHTVLAVPVPALEPFVRARTEHYDPSFVSAGPGWVHAHITVLGPWLPDPDPVDLSRVEALLAEVAAFEVKLAEVQVFPDGLIHLRPEPLEPLRALTRALVEAYPQCPPYAGRFPDPVPHLTLDHTLGGATPEEVGRRLAGVLPVRHTVDRIDLQWWANHDCRVLHRWPLAARRGAP